MQNSRMEHELSHAIISTSPENDADNYFSKIPLVPKQNFKVNQTVRDRLVCCLRHTKHNFRKLGRGKTKN